MIGDLSRYFLTMVVLSVKKYIGDAEKITILRTFLCLRKGIERRRLRLVRVDEISEGVLRIVAKIMKAMVHPVRF